MDELQFPEFHGSPQFLGFQGKILRSWIQKNPWEEPRVGLDPQGGLGLIPLQEILWELFGFQKVPEKIWGVWGIVGKGKNPKILDDGFCGIPEWFGMILGNSGLNPDWR